MTKQETLIFHLMTTWQCLSDKPDLDTPRIWQRIRDQIVGMQKAMIFTDCESYKDIEDDLWFLWQVAAKREDMIHGIA